MQNNCTLDCIENSMNIPNLLNSETIVQDTSDEIEQHILPRFESEIGASADEKEVKISQVTVMRL